MPTRSHLCYLFFAISLCALLLWLFSHRYALTPAPDGIVYKTNRFTGESVALYAGREFKLTSERDKKPSVFRDVSKAELANITGSCDFDVNFLNLCLYNGNASLIVTDVTIAVSDGSIVREYSHETSIKPLSTFPLGISILPIPNRDSFKWWITSARCRPGHK